MWLDGQDQRLDQHCPKCPDSRPMSSVPGLGGDRKVQGKEKGLYRIEIPTPFVCLEMQPSSGARVEVGGVFMTKQSWFPPMPPAPNQGYVLPCPQSMWLELSL